MSLLPERQILKRFFSGDATSEPAHNQTEDSRMILFERDCAFSVVITISINVFPSQFNRINLNVNTGNPLPLQKYIYFSNSWTNKMVHSRKITRCAPLFHC